MFENFPYTNLHELNLDWIIAEVKKAYSPDNPPENMVLSVNGMTGEVVLYEGAVVQLPIVTDDNWNIFRKTGQTQRDSGIEFRSDGKARLINGTNRHEIYSENNPPYKEQNIQLPAVTQTSWNVYRFADNTEVGIKLEKGSAIYRINGTDRIKVYDEQNQPPYPVTSVNGKTGVVQLTFPVTSVNGQTGAVTVQVPFDDTSDNIWEALPITQENNWGVVRRTSGGYAGIKIDTAGGGVNAYLTLSPVGGGTAQELKLLTSADIPASAGVVSINGLTGAVTLYGTNIYLRQESGKTITEEIENNQNAIAIVSDGNTHPAIATGQYVYVKNHSSLTEGLYQAISPIAVNGTLSTSELTSVTSGGLNALRDDLENVITPSSLTDLNFVPSQSNIVYMNRYASAAANAPTTTGSGMLFTLALSIDGATMLQMAVALNGGLFVRVKTSGTWGAWSEK